MGFDDVKVPEGVSPEDEAPRTVRGKIEEMREIGVALIRQSDKLVAYGKMLQEHHAQMAAAGRFTVSSELDWLADLTQFSLKLWTLSQLQTDCITQLYGELSGPPT